MRKNIRAIRVRDLLNKPWASISVFAVLIVTYAVNGWRVANSIWFTMDEGSYLFKGFWFLTGQAQAFVVNGPVVNKPPLAFLIPGLSQLVAPGIASGRLMNVLLLTATLVLLWLTIRRDNNPWWGNAAIFLVLTNPAWVEYYTRVMTQTPALFLMIASLYFTLGKRRTTWQLTLGAIFSVLLLLTRHNLAPFSVLLFAYIAWEHSFKKAVLVFLPAAALFILINVYYWPGIYTYFWYRSLPNVINQPLLKLFQLSAPIAGGNNSQAVDHTLLQIAQELFGSARISLTAALLAIAACVQLPAALKTRSSADKQFVFITVNFWLLTLIHITVVFDKNVLLYSYPAYLLFWAPSIFILLPNIYKFLKGKRLSVGTGAWLATFVVISAGIGLHIYRDVSLPIMNLSIPRLRNWQILPGDVELWRVVVNKFSLDYRAQEYFFAAFAGLLIGVALVGLAILLVKHKTRASGGAMIYLIFLSALLTPTMLLSGTKFDPNCDSDTLSAIQRVGDEINAQVEPNALYFWGSHKSPTVGVMLYVDHALLFPEQLNGQFYYRPEMSLRESEGSIYWSDAQARAWLREADYLIADPNHLTHWDEMLSGMDDVKVDQLKPTQPLESCNVDTSLFIFRLKHAGD